MSDVSISNANASLRGVRVVDCRSRTRTALSTIVVVVSSSSPISFRVFVFRFVFICVVCTLCYSIPLKTSLILPCVATTTLKLR